MIQSGVTGIPLYTESLRRRGIQVASAPTTGGFNPATLNPVAWFKADAGTSTTTDGSAISQWNDQSGNGHHLTQATGANQPLYQSGIQNGKPVVRFDGSNDVLAVTLTQAQPFQVFLVCAFRTAYSANAVLFAGAGGNEPQLFRASSTTLSLWSTSVACTVTTTPQSWHAYEALFNGASSESRVDGGTAVTGQPGANGYTAFKLGADNAGAQAAAIDVGECLLFNGTLNTTDRQNLEGYFRTRWATP